MDAGRFDALTAYAAVNTLRLDDMRPHLFRTHDGGKTWTEINTGLEDGGPTSSVREDPKRKGLLYAASERRVYVSFDDGDHWQSLQLNMAPSSVRDITVKDDDLVAATHGRGFWILDNLTPLRQLEPKVIDADAYLFKPQAAWRVRWNTNTDTPLPPEEPGGLNPPEGAIVDYYLKGAGVGPGHAGGRRARRKARSAGTRATIPYVRSIPRRARCRSTGSGRRWCSRPTPGMHRFTWDLHYQPLAGGGGGGRGGGVNLPIAAVAHNTVPSPTTPWVPAGDLHREAHRERQDVLAADHREAGPARQDTGGRDDADLHADEERILRRGRCAGRACSRHACAHVRIATKLAGSDRRAGGGADGARQEDRGADRCARGRRRTRRRWRRGRGGGGAPATPDSLTGAAAALAAAMNSLSVDVQPTTLQLNALKTAQANGAKAMARVGRTEGADQAGRAQRQDRTDAG